MCSTVSVIHKNSLLLNQHNGNDAPQNYQVSGCVPFGSAPWAKTIISKLVVAQADISL